MFDGKICPYYMISKNRDSLSLQNFFLIFANQESFFQEYIEMESKTFIITFEGLFK